METELILSRPPCVHVSWRLYVVPLPLSSGFSQEGRSEVIPNRSNEMHLNVLIVDKEVCSVCLQVAEHSGSKCVDLLLLWWGSCTLGYWISQASAREAASFRLHLSQIGRCSSYLVYKQRDISFILSQNSNYFLLMLHANHKEGQTRSEVVFRLPLAFFLLSPS